MLTLASARASDAGSYSCVAVSAVGEDRWDVVLHVHGECQAPEAAGSRWGRGCVWMPSEGGGAVGCETRPPDAAAAPAWGLSQCELPQRGRGAARWVEAQGTGRSSVEQEGPVATALGQVGTTALLGKAVWVVGRAWTCGSNPASATSWLCDLGPLGFSGPPVLHL